jgi:hypothetical protein
MDNPLATLGIQDEDKQNKTLHHIFSNFRGEVRAGCAPPPPWIRPWIYIYIYVSKEWLSYKKQDCLPFAPWYLNSLKVLSVIEERKKMYGRKSLTNFITLCCTPLPDRDWNSQHSDPTTMRSRSQKQTFKLKLQNSTVIINCSKV